MKLIEFKTVSMKYGEEYALSRISLSIEENEFVALAGPSGSGKSTILNLAAGLDRPSGGSVSLMEKETSRLDALALTKFRRQHVGFIFQAYNLFPVLTAIENVEYPLALKGMPETERKRAAYQALEAVGLERFSCRLPNELSGGQQQRVAVARAIAHRPKLILADEPTANLDSKTAVKLVELFEALNRDWKITFLFSSHDHRVLEKAKRVIHVLDGKLIENIHDSSSRKKNSKSSNSDVSSSDALGADAFCQRLV